MNWWRNLRLLDNDRKPFGARDLVWRAAKSAPPRCRPGAANVPRVDLLEAGQTLGRSRIEWANTRDSAAKRISEHADQSWPLLYVSSIRDALTPLGAP